MTPIPRYMWVKIINLILALILLFIVMFVWRWTHTWEHWIISWITSILEIVLWMFQKMCISEFDILFVIYFYILKYYNLKIISNNYYFNNYFCFFRFIQNSLILVTKYYLFQQSQHQHLLMIWKNVMNILG
jgi:hypothetical protein